MEDLPMNESAEGALLGLPESQTELDVSLNRLSLVIVNFILSSILEPHGVQHCTQSTNFNVGNYRRQHAKGK